MKTEGSMTTSAAPDDSKKPNISAEQVKKLRERTGAPMMDCKKALQASNGSGHTLLAQPHFSVISLRCWLEVLSCSPSWAAPVRSRSFFTCSAEMFGFLLSSGAAE